MEHLRGKLIIKEEPEWREAGESERIQELWTEFLIGGGGEGGCESKIE